MLTVVTDDEKAIERGEGDRRNSEEVHRGNRFPVIASLGARFIQREIVRSETSKPSMRSSPWHAWRSPRGVLNDHSKDQFLNLLRRLSSPDLPPDLGDQLFQYKRNPALCQRTTVSGVTTMRDCCHPDQNRRTATQKSLSSRPNLGRGCRRFSTASC